MLALTPFFMFFSLRAGLTPANPVHEAPSQSSKSLPKLFWIYWLALFLSVAVEFCMVFWSADYLEQALHMEKASAAQGVSLFLAGMILGRMAGSRLVQR
jgi:fucose permease